MPTIVDKTGPPRWSRATHDHDAVADHVVPYPTMDRGKGTMTILRAGSHWDIIDDLPKDLKLVVPMWHGIMLPMRKDNPEDTVPQ